MRDYTYSQSSFDQLLDIGSVSFQKIDDATDMIKKLGRIRGVSYLEPKSNLEADPWSHSGVNGFGAFPWHTDGAISVNPPRWMMLECLEDELSTQTELLSPDENMLALLRSVTLKIQDISGHIRHLPVITPLDNVRHKLRWDLRIGTPSNIFTSHLIESCAPTNHMDWFPGAVLIVDNFRVLHRRPAVRSDTRRKLRRTYFGGTDVGF